MNILNGKDSFSALYKFFVIGPNKRKFNNFDAGFVGPCIFTHSNKSTN
jgi:hypothetical protein